MIKMARILCCALVISMPSSLLSGQEVDFREIAYFGDSLSDTGNLYAYTGGTFPFSGEGVLFPTPPYYFGRFSNGPNWNEEFNADLEYRAPTPFLLDPTSLNFAFGGAETGTGDSLRGTPNIQVQIGFFQFFNPAFQGDELIVYFAGGNDFTPPEGFSLPAPEDVVANTTDRLKELIFLGGRTFLVIDVPPLGSIPQVRELGPGAELLLNLTVLQHNLLLEQSINELEEQFGVRIYRFSSFSIVSAAIAQPEKFGFTNSTDAAFDLLSGDIVSNPDEYIFWDTIHPTAAAHQLLGSTAAASLATQRMLDYVMDTSSNGLAIRGLFAGWTRLDLSLRLAIANAYVQAGNLPATIGTLQQFQEQVVKLARLRRISRDDAETLISQAQLAMNALDD